MWKERWRHLPDGGYRVGRLSREGVGVEATTVEAQKGGEAVGFDGSHRRKGTKVHAVGTARGVPVGIEGTSARKPEATVLAQVLGAVRVGCRTRPKAVAGDGADDRRPVRTERRRGLRACIPENPRNRRGSRRGRPHCFDRDGYRVL